MNGALASALFPTLLAIAALWSEAAEPASLTEAREAYERAVAKATDPLKTQYIIRLKQLLPKLTKAGDLEGAVAVKKELQALWLEGQWLLTGKTTGRTEVFWFDAKGRCSSGTWTAHEGVVTTSSNPAGWSLRFELPKDEKEPVEIASIHGGQVREKLVMRRTPRKCRSG